MSDTTRDALVRILTGHINFYDDDLADAPDAILAEFLVVPRSNITTDYGVRYGEQGEAATVQEGLSRGGAVMLVRAIRRQQAAFGDEPNTELLSRFKTSWCVISLPEDGQ